jgi:hypothetical protein
MRFCHFGTPRRAPPWANVSRCCATRPTIATCRAQRARAQTWARRARSLRTPRARTITARHASTHSPLGSNCPHPPSHDTNGRTPVSMSSWRPSQAGRGNGGLRRQTPTQPKSRGAK